MTTSILADSINGVGSRLTTFEVELPKYVLGQLAKHRQLSMNFESSRAKPFWRVLAQVCEDPYIPKRFGKPTSGMQPAGYYEGDDHDEAEYGWLHSRGQAVRSALYAAYHFSDDLDQRDWAHNALTATDSLYDVFHSEKIELDWEWHAKNPPQVAKELLNRILEPYMKVKGVVSATEWDNFIQLRANPEAQDDINYLAQDIKRLLAENKPSFVGAGACHLPDLGSNPTEVVENIARVSYGNLRTPSKRGVGELYGELAESDHWSPFEHVAFAQTDTRGSNFHPSWTQLRSVLEGKKK